MAVEVCMGGNVESRAECPAALGLGLRSSAGFYLDSVDMSIPESETFPPSSTATRWAIPRAFL